jgi:hypothetical protein
VPPIVAVESFPYLESTLRTFPKAAVPFTPRVPLLNK